MSGVWFPMRRVRGGHHQPILSLHLRCNGMRSRRPYDFIVDSGASVSFAPLRYMRGLDPDHFEVLRQQTPQQSGLLGASGAPLRGHPVAVELDVPRLGAVRDRIWFSDQLHFGLLGMSDWFEQVGVKFENFASAPTGRRFGLHHVWR